MYCLVSVPWFSNLSWTIFCWTETWNSSSSNSLANLAFFFFFFLLLLLWPEMEEVNKLDYFTLHHITSYAVCIRDLDKLNLIWRFDFRLNPIFATATAASKNTTSFKNSQKYPKRIISLLLSRFSLNPWYTLQFNTNMTLNVFYFINIVNYVTVPSPEVNPSKLCFYSSSDSCC